MRAIPDHLRDVFTARHYTNPRLPFTFLQIIHHSWELNPGCDVDCSRPLHTVLTNWNKATSATNYTAVRP